MARLVSTWLRAGCLTPTPLSTTVQTRSHTGYIGFEGRFWKRESDKIRRLLQSNSLNLQPIKKITFRFDPFSPDCQGIRTLMYSVSFQRTRATNPKCVVKTEVLSDGSEQYVRLDFNDDLEEKPVVFRAGTLTCLEMLYLINKMTLPLVKTKDDPAMSTKASKVTGIKK